MPPTMNAPARRSVRAAMLALFFLLLALVMAARGVANAQAGDVSPDSHVRSSEFGALHMILSPVRPGTAADSARAAATAVTLRESISQYRDTAAAVAAGFRMFAPQLKTQKVYHFTNDWHAVQATIRFDAAKPTSLLYTKRADGSFVLVGAMYTAPKRFDAEKLDARVPLSVARWHKHVNWCMPPRGAIERWLERKDGHPVFGPESPIATRAECDAVQGVFRESLFGWMVHANVFAGDDPEQIWGDDHAGQDMHQGMKVDGAM